MSKRLNREKRGYLLHKPNIAVMTFPFYTMVPKIILKNFLDILEPLSNEIYVITGFFSYTPKPNTKIDIISLKTDDIKGSLLRRIFRALLAQPRVCFKLLKKSKKIDIAIFFLGTRTYLLPLLIAMLLKKKVVLTVTGSVSNAVKMQYGEKLFGLGRVFFVAVRMLERLNFHIADLIAVESESIIDFQGLNKFRKKVTINGAMYVDTNLLTIKKKLKDKRNLVGYIGRLASGKGIPDFIKAMSLILKERGEVEFLIGGDGPLFDEIKKDLNDNGLRDKVKLTGWITHDKLPDYLNELKVLVLPSYSEGLPNIMLEALACGTPVLATPVGGVPDVIKDGETGFILENNSPEVIAENVMLVLEHPDLERIMENGRGLVEREFSYDAAVERYRKILNLL
jgi:glycosyltransferase involved in cell wall biosynthesis